MTLMVFDKEDNLLKVTVQQINGELAIRYLNRDHANAVLNYVWKNSTENKDPIKVVEPEN